MATFSFPKDYVQTQVKDLKRKTLYSLILGFVALPIAFWVANRLTEDSNARLLFLAGVGVAFVFGLINNFLSTKKFLSLKLSVSEDAIRAEYANAKSIEISLSEIRQIADVEGKGLRVSSKTEGKTVFLSKDLSNFDNLYQTLAEWTPIERAKDPFPQLISILFGFGLIGLSFIIWPSTFVEFYPLGLLIILYFSTFAYPLWQRLKKRNST